MAQMFQDVNLNKAGMGEVPHTGQRSEYLHVIVFAPRTPEPKEFTWRRTLKVGEAAKEAAEAFGYRGGNPGLETTGEPPKVLDNNETLAEAHVENGTKLELVDTGGGV